MVDNRMTRSRVGCDRVTIKARIDDDGQAQAGCEGAGEAAAQRHADAGTGGIAGRGGANAGGQPADRVELGAGACRRRAGVAAQALGPPGRAVCRRAQPAVQAAGGGCRSVRLSDRVVDLGAGGRAAEDRVRTRVRHHPGVAGTARVGVFQPTAHGSGDPARRAGHSCLEEEALAGAKKSAAPRAAPSSSSTNRD